MNRSTDWIVNYGPLREYSLGFRVGDIKAESFELHKSLVERREAFSVR
jgi:hypothetical protein